MNNAGNPEYMELTSLLIDLEVRLPHALSERCSTFRTVQRTEGGWPIYVMSFKGEERAFSATDDNQAIAILLQHLASDLAFCPEAKESIRLQHGVASGDRLRLEATGDPALAWPKGGAPAKPLPRKRG